MLSALDQAGVVVLSDAWLAGAVASKKGCVRTPAPGRSTPIPAIIALRPAAMPMPEAMPAVTAEST